MKPYRNPRLLHLAENCEYCCGCGEHGRGTIVACHSNSLEDGKGTGTKAHDITAFLCKDCHDLIDGRTHKELTRDQRNLIFYKGVYNTWLYLMREGILEIK